MLKLRCDSGYTAPEAGRLASGTMDAPVKPEHDGGLG